jgi:hypothetical protein
VSHDPIVDDVRQARQRIFAACGDDLARLLDRLKAEEGREPERVVSTKSLRRKQKQPEARRRRKQR